MSYKITIIDNENGDVLLDEENAKAIVGAVANEDGCHCMGHTRCNALEFWSVLSGVDKAKDSLLENNPTIGALYAMKGLMDLCGSNSDHTKAN